MVCMVCMAHIPVTNKQLFDLAMMTITGVLKVYHVFLTHTPWLVLL